MRFVLGALALLATADKLLLTLLTRRDDPDRWRDIAPSTRVVAQVPSSRPARLAWEQLRAHQVVRDEGANLWHGPHYTMPLRAAAPCVVTIHDLTFFDHPEWHERSKVVFFRRMIRAVARRATLVVCVSEYTADRLRAQVDPRADVFATAICLFRATTGRIPFNGKNEAEVLAATLDCRYPRPSELIPDFPP